MIYLTLSIISLSVIIISGCSSTPQRQTPAPGTEKRSTTQQHLSNNAHQSAAKTHNNEVQVFPYIAAPAVRATPIIVAAPIPITDFNTSNAEATTPMRSNPTTTDHTPAPHPHNIISTTTHASATTARTLPKKKTTTHNSKSSTVDESADDEQSATPVVRKKHPKPKPTVLASLTKPPSAIAPLKDTRSTPMKALLQQADAQRASGDLTRAAATLERGLRIEPRNPYFWNRLAHIRLEQGLFGQASNMAAKSNTMAGNIPSLIQENQRIITEANKRSGH